MLEHLTAHTTGLLHVSAGLLALALGTAIVFLRKGTSGHRWLGRGYLLAMLLLNGTSLSVYEVFGGFGAFHWLALVSLATLLAGYAAVRWRSPGWIPRHAYFMAGSYVGLLAAAVAEVASRVPGWRFGPSVLLSSAAVIVFGVWIMRTSIPRIIGETPADSG